MNGYDVIGDVHGHADKLEGLLRTMGYRRRDGAWRHAEREVVFIGDLIDRGTQNLDTLNIARAMIDAGTARMVLGNHELNAIAWATPDPDRPGEHLRPRTGTVGDKNRSQHKEFLAEVGEESRLHIDLIAWFMTIPLWLDLDGLRVVHACWDPLAMAALRPSLSNTGGLTHELAIRSSRSQLPEYCHVETILKGPEIHLPERYWYTDKDGHLRENARFSWWDGDAATLRRAAEIPSGARGTDGQPLPELPDDPIGDLALPRYTDGVPVIYGHYWRTGATRVISPTAACVDYSAGKGGPLVAYRWYGEPTLSDLGFVSFPENLWS